MTRFVAGAFTSIAAAAGMQAQTVSTPATPIALPNGTSFIGQADLPSILSGPLQQMGGRMTNANVATITLNGGITDTNGTRAVQIIIQTPGYLSYSEGTTVAKA